MCRRALGPTPSNETFPVTEPSVVRFDASGHRIGGSRGARWVGNGVAFTPPAQGREIEALITDDALASHFGAYVHASDGASRAVSQRCVVAKAQMVATFWTCCTPRYKTSIGAENTCANFRNEVLSQCQLAGEVRSPESGAASGSLTVNSLPRSLPSDRTSTKP